MEIFTQSRGHLKKKNVIKNWIKVLFFIEFE